MSDILSGIYFDCQSYQQPLTDFLMLPGDDKRLNISSSSQGMLKKELVLIIHIQRQVRVHNLGKCHTCLHTGEVTKA